MADTEEEGGANHCDFVLVYATQYPTHAETAAYKFPNAAVCHTWQATVEEVKRQIAEINKSPVEERPTLYRAWLEQVEAFRLKWGDHMVPRDVQLATNRVQENMTLPKTNWSY